MEDPYARHGRDKFLELLIDSFSKVNRRDFDRPPLISAVRDLLGNFQFRQLRTLPGATLDVLIRKIGRQQNQENHWYILAYDDIRMLPMRLATYLVGGRSVRACV